MDVQPLIAWLAPIASTLAVAAGQLALNERFKKADEKRDEAREEANERRKMEAEWRKAIEAKLDDQDNKIQAILESQVTRMRGDITNQIHRYIDDLHAASTEEKKSLWAEYEVYCNLCDEYGIENHFVEKLVMQVMELPDREFPNKD